MKQINQSLIQKFIKKSPDRYQMENLSELEQVLQNATFPTKEKKVIFQMPYGIKLNCEQNYSPVFFVEGEYDEYKAEEFVQNYLDENYAYLELTDSSTENKLPILVTPRLILNYGIEIGSSIILPQFPVLVHSKDNVGLPIIDLYNEDIDFEKVSKKIYEIEKQNQGEN